MTARQYILPLAGELLVDLFAGGGGASTGIETATGRHVDIAINHDPQAVALHTVNHPQTRHFVSDVFEVDPLTVTAGRPVGLLWASPDCTFHSKARGGKPHRDRKQANKRRALAGVVIRWAKAVRPRVICLENVEEFQHWGPLGGDGQPCPKRRGSSFRRWCASLRTLGYTVEWRELRACDYGAPTIRKRLFLVARCDGAPIVWPAPTHGAPDSLPVRQRKLLPWRMAAECIDWSVPAPSIFGRARPLADATCRRIAKGVVRYVIEAAEPFIVGVGGRAGQSPERSLSKPFGTVTSKADAALVAAFLAKHYTGVVGAPLDAPAGTVTTVDHHSLVAASLLKMRGDNVGSAADAPLHTISAGGTHHAAVHAFLTAYYGSEGDGQPLGDPLRTAPTRDRFGLVMVDGAPYAISDIGLRMLTPRELYRAQGFPAWYVIDRGADGGALTKTAQVRMCGNSVCPPVAAALVAANYAEAQAGVLMEAAA